MAKKPRATLVPPPLERALVVATCGAPHGVRGELRLKSHMANPLDLGQYGPLFDLQGRAFVLVEGRLLKDDMLVVRFEGLTDRDAAAGLTGRDLVIDRALLPEVTDDDEFYHADLIGLPVFAQGTGARVGEIRAVHNFKAGDFLEIVPAKRAAQAGEARAAGAKSAGAVSAGTWLLPFLKAAVPVISLGDKRVEIMPDFLLKPESRPPHLDKPLQPPKKSNGVRPGSGTEAPEAWEDEAQEAQEAQEIQETQEAEIQETRAPALTIDPPPKA